MTNKTSKASSPSASGATGAAGAADTSGATGDMTIIGGSRPKRIAARRDSWTPEQRQRFLETLTLDCNVTRAAQAAGKSRWSAYRRRQTNAKFREAWEDAIHESIELLKLELLERARFGTPERVPTAAEIESGEDRAIVRKHNDAVALRLIEFHRATWERVIERRRARAASEAADSAAAERMRARLRKLRATVLARIQAGKPVE